MLDGDASLIEPVLIESLNSANETSEADIPPYCPDVRGSLPETEVQLILDSHFDTDVLGLCQLCCTTTCPIILCSFSSLLMHEWASRFVFSFYVITSVLIPGTVKICKCMC